MDSDRVRADLARLADDAAAAPAVPPSVTARVVSALRAAPPPAHAARRSAARLGAAVGVAAALAAAGLGTFMLLRSGAPATRPSAQHLTTEPPPVTVPLSDAEIVGLLTGAPRPRPCWRCARTAVRPIRVCSPTPKSAVRSAHTEQRDIPWCS